MNQFLRQHPSGRTRLAAGPALLSLVEQPRDLEVAREAVLDSFASVHCGQFGRSIRDLDTALLHNPEDSTAWYLRALCYLAGNDLELVNRDLRRMIALEARDTDQPYRRTQRLERIQGALRVVLGRIEDDLKTR